MSDQIFIRGGRRLAGEYRVQGNKNAALPLLAAALLAPAGVTFRNVPRIKDVMNMLRLLEAVGSSVEWRNDRLVLGSPSLHTPKLPGPIVEMLRGAILLFGPLAASFGQVECALPGGCPIGKRSFDTHWSVFQSAGFEVNEAGGRVEVRRIRNVEHPHVYLEEASVTATENALLLFSFLGAGTIENPAREPHVLAVVDFLRQLGCEIELHPLHFRVIRGVTPSLGHIEFRVPGDYIDAGTIAIAASATGGQIQLKGITNADLLGISPVLKGFGIEMRRLSEDSWQVAPSILTSPDQVIAGPWPLFPTDLVSLAIVLATQAKGLCLIHDWMYEARMFFVDKLVRMGAHITMCDPHRVMVEGPTRLRGIRLESPDIRAGMALVVAGLCAEGTTVIEHAEVIARGYEAVVGRLEKIGAEISGTLL